MATELAKQYDITCEQLKAEGKSTGVSETLTQLDWSKVLANAGINSAVSAFSTFVATSPKYQKLLTTIKTKLNVSSQNYSQELLSYINKRLDNRVATGAGKLDGLVGKVDNRVDDIAQAALRDQDILDELVKTNNAISDAGKKFWANHEINVTRYLREILGNTKVGRQITVDVTLTNGQKFTCRLDNLIDVGNNRFRIVDAKSSIVQDLSGKTAADLVNDMSTTNQKLLYDGLKKNAIQQIKPRGDLAKQFFGNNLPNNINVEKSVDFFVNDTALEGYGIFKKTLIQ